MKKTPKGPAGKYAWTVKVGEKGQFVIPKEARELFGIHPGDTLILLGDKKRGLAIPPHDAMQMFAARLFDQGIISFDDDEEEE